MTFTERQWVEVTTFGDLIVRAAARHPDSDAVVFPEARHAFSSLLAAAERAARSLLGLGVRPGDHVGILMPNCMDFVEVMFGATLIGAPVMPINARFKGRELSYVTRDADLRLLVTSDIIDQHIDYVAVLHDCLPGPADAPDVGERGEIWCRGYNVFEGYYKDPVKTQECFDDDGWFNAGDIGRMDADGRVGYLGRVKDMLKVGGESVAAVEIESYLQTHNAVALAQVVGIPDGRYVEVPAAFVELMPGAEIAESDLTAYCKGNIASFEVSRYVRFVQVWPISATKIQKFRLQEQPCNELGLTRDASGVPN